MTGCIILVDNSNIFIEGQKFSAIRKGIIRKKGQSTQPQDKTWRLDFGNLLTELAKGRPVEAALLVGSRPPPNDSVWAAAKANGFDVITHERDRRGEEKAVDTEIVAQGTKLVLTKKPPGHLIIASGDRDFVPLVKLAKEAGWKVEMCAFEGSFDPKGQMATEVDEVRPLNKVIDKIGRQESERKN